MDRALAQFQQPADYVGSGRNKAPVGEKGFCHIGYTREQLLKLLTRKKGKTDE